MTDILQTIAAESALRVARAKEALPPEDCRSRALGLPCETGFPLEQALRKPELSFLCECKKASPSKGLIAPAFPYLRIAKDYERAGAAGISVLTEPLHFLGRNEYLQAISAAVSLPCLRKDFVVDEYMLYETKCLGASAVLLIAALLETGTLARYREICDTLGLTALVEVHNEEELASALEAGARVVGVNNRNLRDFTVDLQTSLRLRPLAPAKVLFVAESGIRTRADVALLEEAGYHGVLVGETLMRASDKKQALDQLRGVE